MNRNFHDMPVSQEGWEYMMAEDARQNAAGAAVAGFAIIAACFMFGFIAGVIFMVVLT